MSSFPDHCIQGAFEYKEWWESTSELRQGSLVKFICPFFDKEAWRLRPIGRDNPTEHSGARVKIERYTLASRNIDKNFPVAALTTNKSESLGVWRTKVRPALVLRVNKTTRTEDALKADTLLVSPYYGIKPGSRAGFPAEFIRAVKDVNFPQFSWDLLPIGKEPNGSLLRFDRTLTIPRKARQTYEDTGFGLSEQALEYMLDWFNFYLSGVLDDGTDLYSLASLLNEAIV